MFPRLKFQIFDKDGAYVNTSILVDPELQFEQIIQYLGNHHYTRLSVHS